MNFSLGIGLAALVFFLWSAISWVALPWQRGLFKSFKDEVRLTEVLAEQAPGSGVYGLPAEPRYPPGASKEQRDAIDQAVMDKMQRGPVVFAVVARGRMGSFAEMLLPAFLGNLVTSLIFGWMLSRTAGLGYGERVAFVFLASVAAGVACRVPDWNWHKFPLDYTLVNMASLAFGWLCSGAVLAWFVKGRGRGKRDW